MKKITVFLAMAVMLLLCLTGCGGREAYAGKWEASEIVTNNSSIKELGGLPISALIRFDLDESGSAKWESPLENVKDPSKDGISARWKIKDGKVVLRVSQPDQDNKIMEFEPKDGKLVISESGTEIILVSVDEYTPIDENAVQSLLSIYNFTSIMGG